MATLKDVARESGLTVGTVSRVLNNRGYISEQTRAKVYEVMKQLNYQPNEMARALSKQQSNVIGLIVPHITHPYFAKMINAIEEAASRSNYRILLFSSRFKDEKEEEYIEMCKSNRVAGVILCSGALSTEKLANLGCPVVTIERSIGAGTAGVECDNYQGGVLATQHLIDQGCRHLVHLAGVPNEAMPGDERQHAFIDICEKNGISHIEFASPKVSYEETDYYTMIQQVLDQYPETDGIFASSDVIAAQTIQVCHHRGINVPEQLKIVGFDDVSIAALTSPELTTIQQPVQQMAEAAVFSLIQAISGSVVAAKTMFPVSLIVRESTGVDNK